MSSSVASAESSESMCSIEGAMLWQINLRNDVLLNLAAASTWLSQVMHSALLVPSKIFMFFIICLLMSSFFTHVRIYIRVSVMLSEGAGDVPLNGVWIAVLVLGWTFSKRFSNSGLLFVVFGSSRLVPVV